MNLFRKILFFYYDGFRSMTVGRKLWIIILIKLLIIFIILKLFFFPDFLNTKVENREDKGNYVRDQLIIRQ